MSSPAPSASVAMSVTRVKVQPGVTASRDSAQTRARAESSESAQLPQ